MSKRDELAVVLGEHLGKCMRFGLPCSEVRPRDQWCGRCDLTACATDAVLAWLGGQFDEGLREGVMLGIAGTQKPCRKAIRDNGGCVTDFGPCLCASETDAALAVVRERLGLSGAAQDAQDGTVGPGSVPMGTGEGAAPNGAQIEDFEGGR